MMRTGHLETEQNTSRLANGRQLLLLRRCCCCHTMHLHQCAPQTCGYRKERQPMALLYQNCELWRCCCCGAAAAADPTHSTANSGQTKAPKHCCCCGAAAAAIPCSFICAHFPLLSTLHPQAGLNNVNRPRLVAVAPFRVAPQIGARAFNARLTQRAATDGVTVL